MEDDDQIETEFCNNCKKDIPTVNFVMHTSHCSRNITLCKLCNEPVRTSEKDEHFKEYHEKVKCECGESIEKMNLDNHKESDCKSRKVVCEFCELELPFSEMSSHKEYCGSRTELCDKCNKYIKHKDLEDHLNSDCQNIVTSVQNNAMASTSQNRHRNPLDTMIQNVDFGNSFEHEFDSRSFEYGSLFDVEHIYPQEFVPRNNRVAARGPNAQQKTRRDQNDFDNEVDYAARILKQNQLEGDELIAAILACEDDFEEPSQDNLRNQLFDHSSFEHVSNSNVNEDPEADSTLDQTFLPCEFCGKAIEEQDLIRHQSGCQLTSMSRGSYPNLRSQPRSLPPIDFNQYDSMGERDNRTDDHDDTLLPCEFCQELVKSDFLFSHQSMCDPQRTRPSSVDHYNDFLYEPEPDPHISNSSRPRDNTRPPRPSRPVVNERFEDDFDWPSSNESTETREIERSEHGFFNSGSESYISDLLPNSSTSPQNDSREPRYGHALLNGTGSTQKISSKSSSRKQGGRKNTPPQGQKGRSDFSPPTRGTDESSDRNDRAFQRKGSPKTIISNSRESSGSGTRSSGFRQVQPKVSNLRKNADRSERSRYNDGREAEGPLQSTLTHSQGSLQTDLPAKPRPRPLHEKNKTSVPQMSESRKKMVASGQPTRKSEPFQHTQETRKQLNRMAPSSSKPQASSDSRRQDGVQRKKKGVERGREREDTRSLEREGSRATEAKPKTTRKKIA